MAKEPILSAKDVEIQFSVRGRKLMAIRKCSLDLYEGETLAIVGESGSGKSVFTKSFIGMLDANGTITGGSITYNGVDISKYKTEDEWMTIRGKKIAMVMQDPMTSLNPLKKIGKQIQESIELHQGLKGEEAKKEAIEMLKRVGIPDPERRYNQYPHEFSGGMRQRVVIAIAVACRPQILICDEPTTALDVTIQAQILNLLMDLQEEYKLTCIFVTHDLSVVRFLCDRIAVFHRGRIVELAEKVQGWGAREIMVDVITCGFGAVQAIAEDPSIKVPIHVHRTMHGAFTKDPRHGVAMLPLTKLVRMVGGDALHIGTLGVGKMTGAKADDGNLEACLGDDVPYRQVMPVCSGGVHPGLVGEIVRRAGTNVQIQAGGGVAGYPGGVRSGAMAMSQAVDAAFLGIDADEYAKDHAELAVALEKWGSR